MITIDDRENRSDIPELLSDIDAEYEINRLAVGDYLVRDRVIERKTANDFISSLIDGSIDTQLYELSKNQKFSYVAIIGSVNQALLNAHYRDYKMPPRQIWWAKFASMIVKRAPGGEEGIIIPLQFQTPFDFALFLKKFEQKLIEFEEDDIPRLPTLKKVNWSASDRSLRLLCAIPGIGEKYGEALLEKFETIQRIANASKSELKEVYGIGTKTAEKIKGIFTEEYVTEE